MSSSFAVTGPVTKLPLPVKRSEKKKLRKLGFVLRRTHEKGDDELIDQRIFSEIKKNPSGREVQLFLAKRIVTELAF